MELSPREKDKLLISSFPTVTRDFAFVLEKNIPAEKLIKTICDVNKDLIKDVNIFDVYEGSNIEENKKSIAVEVKLESKEATLTEKEINKVADDIVVCVEKNTGGKLRS